MYDVLRLLEALSDADRDFLLQAGVEYQFIANSRIIQEGSQPDAIYVVLDGLVGVFAEALGSQPMARLGPGQVFGELSFLDGEAAAADVTVLENSLLLALPFAALRERIAADPGFGARFYRALAGFVSGLLRHAVSEMGRLWADAGEIHEQSSSSWDELAAGIESFKRLMTEADKAGLANDGVVPAEVERQVLDAHRDLALELNARLGDDCGLSEDVRSELGHRVQRELLPYVHSSLLGERMYAKPRGYAGDYLTIANMYADVAEGSGRTGRIIDRALRQQPACVAVQNRRGLLADEIAAARAANGAANDGAVTRVTSLAAGPATELFDVFASLDDKTELAATCIDIDRQALEFVTECRDRAGLQRQMELHNGNLVYLASGRQKLDLPPQDLIYSIGLIDYFSDKFVIRLLDYVHTLLKPGGRVILGNFHTDNPTKALMDYVLDWKLIHRDEDDMNRLFAASAFGAPCSRIVYEGAGVNLFAEGVKVATSERNGAIPARTSRPRPAASAAGV